MKSYPFKKLIIINGIHIERIQIHSQTKDLLKLLIEKNFFLFQSVFEQSIDIYNCPEYTDHSILSHVVIGFDNEICEIRYYTTELK